MVTATHNNGSRNAILLSCFSVVSYFALYALNLLLARQLSLDEFNDYNVGVSTLLLLAAIAPLGLEKYSLKIIPVYLQRESWGQLRGFLQFAIALALCVSLILSLAFDGLLESILMLSGEGWHSAIPMIVACLPLLTLFLILLELGTAFGAPLTASAIYRTLLPLLLLASNLAVWKSSTPLTGLTAGWCYAFSWFVATLVMIGIVVSKLPAQLQNSKSEYDRKIVWISESTPLLLSGLLLAVLTQSGVIVLELSDNFSLEASVFAVAMQTGTFVVLLTTSTNRFYLPQVSLFLERSDQAGLVRLRDQRFWLIGSMATVFVVVVLLFGRVLLGLFGENFVQGYPATCVVAVGAAISTVFSLAPIGLQFAGQHRYVIQCQALATMASVGMCIALANRFGALGAAIAYTVPISCLYLYLGSVAFHRLHREGKLR